MSPDRNIDEKTLTEFEELGIKEDEPIFTTGVICRILNIPIWVLKQLDSEGVVSPPRTAGATRLYSLKDLGLVKRAWYYMEEHRVKVNGIKVILKIEHQQED